MAFLLDGQKPNRRSRKRFPTSVCVAKTIPPTPTRGEPMKFRYVRIVKKRYTLIHAASHIRNADPPTSIWTFRRAFLLSAREATETSQVISGECVCRESDFCCDRRSNGISICPHRKETSYSYTWGSERPKRRPIGLVSKPSLGRIY